MGYADAKAIFWAVIFLFGGIGLIWLGSPWGLPPPEWSWNWAGPGVMFFIIGLLTILWYVYIFMNEQRFIKSATDISSMTSMPEESLNVTSPETQKPPVNSPFCKTCGRTPKIIQESNQYYCEHCKKHYSKEES